MADHLTDTEKLVAHYTNLLELYNRLEKISDEIFAAITDSSLLGTVPANLKEKLALVAAIQEESGKIAALKRKIRLSERERIEIRKTEEKLTAVVNKVIGQEDRSRELLQKQGVKISRN